MRVGWPIILGYGEATRLIVAWCELRQDFRHFRTDRMIEIEVLEATHGLRKGDLRRRWERWREEQRSLAVRPLIAMAITAKTTLLLPVSLIATRLFKRPITNWFYCQFSFYQRKMGADTVKILCF